MFPRGWGNCATVADRATPLGRTVKYHNRGERMGGLVPIVARHFGTPARDNAPINGT